MFKKEEVKTGKSKCNAHVANQFKIDTTLKEKKQTKAWPKSFNPFITDQKTFPRSWSQFRLKSYY